MPSILVRAARERALSVTDETNSDACVVRSKGEPDNPAIVFTGTPAQRLEVEGVAVVRPHLPQVFCRRRGAVVCRTANVKLKGRLNVVEPSLAAIGRERPAGVVGKVRDRSVNVEKFGARFSSVVSIKVPTGGPNLAITRAAKAIVR
ncbi:hypothetical protein [Sinorhizobium meliloti]|uniref:hypothetical protein n=1 Tax=Rhizobium meliloti TaxID=382 RepID=UPI000361BC5A|nr:hypothetical protein [Sinorhizobium meliloti]